MAFQRSTLLALLVLVIAALFAHAQEVDLPSAADDTSISLRTEDEATAAVANCALAINCGQCKVRGLDDVVKGAVISHVSAPVL